MKIFATLDQAERLGYDKKSLLAGIKTGTIEAKPSFEGHIMVFVEMRTKEEIIKDNYGDLIGQGITISKGAKKYNVPKRNIYHWMKKYGWISVVDESYPVKINEAELAYVADIYQKRKEAKTLAGAPLLDENGIEYELMHPELSQKRKEDLN